MSIDRQMAYSRPDGSRADVPRAAPAKMMGYDRARPITGKMTYITGPCPHRPASRWSGLAAMFGVEAPAPTPRPQSHFAGIVMDEATPDPSKPMPFAKPLKPTAFTKPLKPLKPKEITMDEYDDLPGARRAGEDNEETSPADESRDAIVGYLQSKGAYEDELKQFLDLWRCIHARPARQGQAQDSRPRRAPDANAHRRYVEKFPDAGRLG